MAGLFVAGVQRSTGLTPQPDGVPVRKAQSRKAFFLRLSASFIAKLEVRTFGAPWCRLKIGWQPIRRLRVLRHPNHPTDSIGRCRVLVGRRLACVAETVDADS